MNQFVTGLLWGIGGSLILVPLFIWFGHIIKGTFERRKVKRLINKKEFLTPIDEKDYDVKAWENEIDTSKFKEEKEHLNEIFIKDEDRVKEEVKIEEKNNELQP
jgi:hypothetical protein